VVSNVNVNVNLNVVDLLEFVDVHVHVEHLPSSVTDRPAVELDRPGSSGSRTGHLHVPPLY
jgi:hypothetical protein